MSVPKLRFSEFLDAGEWEEKEVGEVFKVTRGEVLSMTLVKDTKTIEMPYPVYSSQTKNNGLSGFYSEYLYEDAITWTTDGANAGDVNYRPGKFYCTNVCGVLLNIDGYANLCIAALINSVSKNYVSYVGNPKLMNGVMSKIKIPFSSLPEQQKIADCLTSIADRITAETQKLATLKAHKKGLMQQLFPAEGETLPKLRFPEFQDSGEWEEKRLEDIAPLQRGFDLPSDQIKLGNIPIVYSNGIQNFHNIGMAEAPGIVTGRSGTIGKIHFIEEGNYWPHNTSLWVTSFKGNFPKFIYYLYKSIGTVRFASGSGVPTLNRNYVHAFNTSLPASLEEQQKIADFLTSIDEAIAAQTQKIATLKTHKKGLMQQLFPSV